MEENYLLEKEYTVSYDLFREAYRAFQKKYIYPKSYLFMGLFLILAADFIYAAVKDPGNVFAYILIAACAAFAFREWFNPRKMRNNLVDAVREMGEPVYKICIAGDYVDISTVKAPVSAESDDNDEDIDFPDDIDPMPEHTRLEKNGDLEILEYDSFFLLLSGKNVFYIIPKEDLTEKELEIVRNCAS